MDIRHDTAKQRFKTGHDDPGFVEYRDRGDGMFELTRTEVPSQLEGKGVGSALARNALDYARDNDLRVVPTCPFIRSYIEKHPEYQDLVAS